MLSIIYSMYKVENMEYIINNNFQQPNKRGETMCDYDWKREEAEEDYNRTMTEDMYVEEYDEEEEYDEGYSDEDFPVPYHF